MKIDDLLNFSKQFSVLIPINENSGIKLQRLLGKAPGFSVWGS